MEKILWSILTSTTLLFTSCDSTPPPSAIMPVPTKEQIEWQKLEQYAFVHFGLNTFNDLEWGYGNTPASTFDPINLDARQWVEIMKKAGLKGVILTAKHHDGFCLWPTATTDYSVKNSPWKNGKGDMVKDLADACKESGLKFGVYLSPWDRNNKHYGTEEYVKIFHAQIDELISNYGDVFEYWFDGANGGNGWYGGADETRSINAREYYQYEKAAEMIKAKHPNVMIFGGTSPTIRWIGNESGWAGETNWSAFDFRDGRPDYEAQWGYIDGKQWLPGETNVSLRPGWFYHHREDHQVRSIGNLMNLYYQSVGRNTTFLLNFPIAPSGRVHPIDSARIVEWGNHIRTEFKDNRLINAKNITATNTRGKSYAANKVNDNNWESYWATEDEVSTATLQFEMKEPTMLNRLMLQEYIPLGQRVESFNVEVECENKWVPIATSDTMSTIGYKRLIRFSTVNATGLRIHFSKAKGVLCINNIEAYLAPMILEEPNITRNLNDEVKISTTLKGVDILYTIDGTEPGISNAKRYSEPFKFVQKGEIKAVVYDPLQNKTSPVQTRKMDIPNSYYTVSNINDDKTKYLFDGNGYSSFHLPKGVKELNIRLKEQQTLKGFKYVPNQGRDATGHIDRYEFYVENKLVISGEFSNIKNNPIEQEVLFDAIRGQNVKLKIKRVVDDLSHIGIGEFSLISEN